MPGDEKGARAFVRSPVGEAGDMRRNAVLGHFPPDPRRGDLWAQLRGKCRFVLLAPLGIGSCGRNGRQHVPRCDPLRHRLHDMPGIGPAARYRDQREFADPQMPQHLAELAGVIVKRPLGIESGIAKPVTLHRNDPQLEPIAHRIKEGDQFGRAAAGANPAQKQDRLPACLAGVGEMDRPAFAGGQALHRGADRIEPVREHDRIGGTGFGHCGRGQRQGRNYGNHVFHRTGSVSRLRSSTSICACSPARSRLRHRYRYTAADTGRPTSIETSALPKASATGPT